MRSAARTPRFGLALPCVRCDQVGTGARGLTRSSNSFPLWHVLTVQVGSKAFLGGEVLYRPSIRWPGLQQLCRTRSFHRSDILRQAVRALVGVIGVEHTGDRACGTNPAHSIWSISSIIRISFDSAATFDNTSFPRSRSDTRGPRSSLSGC